MVAQACCSPARYGAEAAGGEWTASVVGIDPHKRTLTATVAARSFYRRMMRDLKAANTLPVAS